MDERKIFEELAIAPLLAKYKRGEVLSVLENKTIEIWVKESESNRAVFDQLQNDAQLAADLIDYDIAGSRNESGLQLLRERLRKRKSRERMNSYWRTAVAVIFAFSIMASVYYYSLWSGKLGDNIVMTTPDINPGKDQATLTFEDGKTVELKGKPIRSDASGTYYSDGKAVAPKTVQYATLSTPRKGQYKMTLADGTQVWLNAESSLRFPTQFTASERVVETDR